MAQVKKLSVATVFGKIKLSELIDLSKKGESMPIMQAIGTAVGTKQGTSSYGDWECLEGDFEAVNMKDGVVSRAGILFLPDVALIPVKVALAGNKAVQFAVQIDAVYVAEKEGHKPGGSPYEYTFKHLLEMGESDPIAQIKARIAEQTQKRIAPPAPPAAQEEEPAKKKGK